MGVKVKPGMWCDYCGVPVYRQGSSHRIRNSASVLTAPLTIGYSLLGAKAGKWRLQRYDRRFGRRTESSEVPRRHRRKATGAGALRSLRSAVRARRALSVASQRSALSSSSDSAAPLSQGHDPFWTLSRDH